jgi:hypothetical protein
MSGVAARAHKDRAFSANASGGLRNLAAAKRAA